jgi:hypothetical protein
MLFEYLDYIFDSNHRNLIHKCNELQFKCVNGVFNKKEINYHKKNIIEYDIFLDNELNDIFYIKTPLCKIIKNDYPYITFEICNAYDNIQVKLFECILQQLKYKLMDKKCKNFIFEPFIYRNYESKFIRIKFLENYSKCYLRNNEYINDYKTYLENFENKNYIICLALHKKWIDIENGNIGLEWNIYQIKSINIEPEIVDFNLSTIYFNDFNKCANVIPIPPPPPLPPVFDLNKHKIIVKKIDIVSNLKKNLPNTNIVVPSLSDIQNILAKMKKKNC